MDTVHNLSDEPKKRTATNRAKSKQPKVPSSSPKDSTTKPQSIAASGAIANDLLTSGNHSIPDSLHIHNAQSSIDNGQSSFKPTPAGKEDIPRTQNNEEDDDVEADVAFVDPDADEEATQLFLNMASGFRRGGHIDPKFMAGFEAMRAKVEEARAAEGKGKGGLGTAEASGRGGSAEVEDRTEGKRAPDMGQVGVIVAPMTGTTNGDRKPAFVILMYV